MSNLKPAIPMSPQPTKRCRFRLGRPRSIQSIAGKTIVKYVVQIKWLCFWMDFAEFYSIAEANEACQDLNSQYRGYNEQAK